MSASFVGTLQDQVDRAFARDLTVKAQGFTIEQGGGPGVPRSVQRAIDAMPEAGAVAPVRALLLDLPQLKGGAAQGIAIGVDPAKQPRLDGTEFKDISQASAYAGLQGGGVLLGRLYADRAGLERGDTLELVGPAGQRRAKIVGLMNSVGAMAGMEMRLSLATMKRVYGDHQPAELAVEARSPDLRHRLETRVAALLDREYPNLETQSAAEARDEAGQEINRMFSMFNAIVIIAVIVSLLGVINTLAMSVIERTREIGVLRALGASRWQVRSTMLDESLMITIAGSVVGVAAGTLIGFIWVRGLESILPGIGFHFPGPIALGVAIAAVVLGVIAAIIPARRAARLKVITALTYE
jgi:putative ABC transport system permease protein